MSVDSPPDEQNRTIAIGASIARDGFVFVDGASMQRLFAGFGTLSGWESFADSWNDLQVDAYMADGGRYRRRRHALFVIDEHGMLHRRPHGPHYQAVDYNPLNGGIERWFEPVTAAVADSALMRAILLGCHALFASAAGISTAWNIEVHQFRIEARAGEPGLPTPEGMHRDGVDYVLAMMVCRRNIASGTTTVHAADGRTLGNFTLAQSFDAALLDDNRVWHGVTPVAPFDASAVAYRDVLVVTFRRGEWAAEGSGVQS